MFLGMYMEALDTGEVVITRLVGGETSIGALTTDTVVPGDQLVAIDDRSVFNLSIDEVKLQIVGGSNKDVENVDLKIYRPSCNFQFVVHVPRPKPRNQPHQSGGAIALTPRARGPVVSNGQFDGTASNLYVEWMGAVLKEEDGIILFQKLDVDGAASTLLRHPSVRLQEGDVIKEINGQHISTGCDRALEHAKHLLLGDGSASHMFTIVVMRPMTGRTITAVLPRPAIAEKMPKILQLDKSHNMLKECMIQSPRPSDPAERKGIFTNSPPEAHIVSTPAHYQEILSLHLDMNNSAEPSSQRSAMPELESLHTPMRCESHASNSVIPLERFTNATPVLENHTHQLLVNPNTLTSNTEEPFRLSFADALARALTGDCDRSVSYDGEFVKDGRMLDFTNTTEAAYEQQRRNTETSRMMMDLDICHSNVDIALARNELPRAFEWLEKASIITGRLGLVDDLRRDASLAKIRSHQMLQVCLRIVHERPLLVLCPVSCHSQS